jgi:hypothetical protein
VPGGGAIPNPVEKLEEDAEKTKRTYDELEGVTHDSALDLPEQGDAPYPPSAKCEGISMVWNEVSKTKQPHRCQNPPVAWHEGAYAWLCENHLRGANRRKQSGRTIAAVRGLGDDIPPEPGTSPIPGGTIRLYHYTRKAGQPTRRLRGSSNPTPKGELRELAMVWGSADARPPGQGVGVLRPRRRPDIDAGRAYDTVTLLATPSTSSHPQAWMSPTGSDFRPIPWLPKG